MAHVTREAKPHPESTVPALQASTQRTAKVCSHSLLQEKLSHLLQAELVQTLLSDHTAAMGRGHAGFFFFPLCLVPATSHREARVWAEEGSSEPTHPNRQEDILPQ